MTKEVLEQIARAINVQAARSPSSHRFGDDLVYIIDIMATWPKPAALKQQLIPMHQAGMIELSRADLPAAMDADKLAASEVSAFEGLVTYHFVRVPRAAA